MEELKRKLHNAINEYGLRSEEALRLSEELDTVVVQEQKKIYLAMGV